MSNIDKQALREATGKVDSGDWSYEEFNRLDLPGGSFVKIDGRDAVYCLNKPVGGIKQSRAVIAFIATFNPKVARALLDELDVKEEQRANWFQMAQKLGEDLDAAERHIAETDQRNAELTARIEPMDRRIAELEAREVTLPAEKFCPSEYAGSQYWEETEVWNKAIFACAVAVRAAGIKVKES
ncbi:hypothetical protein DMU02_16560 [Salmonella enterica]|nr:hypothetical protein [Salmonella enterica]